jgi:DNA-directed RNA polymerase specialized sigma24 family protein
MTPAELVVALDVSKKAARRYARRCWWADVADLEQEAVLATVKAANTFDPSVGVPFAGYAWRAAILALKPYLWRQSSPVSASWGDIIGRKLEGLQRVAVDLTIPDDREDADDALDSKRWCEQVWKRAVALDPSGGLAVEVLLLGEKSADVARRHNVPVQTVYNATTRAKARMTNDKELYALWENRD